MSHNALVSIVGTQKLVLLFMQAGCNADVYWRIEGCDYCTPLPLQQTKLGSTICVRLALLGHPGGVALFSRTPVCPLHWCVTWSVCNISHYDLVALLWAAMISAYVLVILV